MAELPASLVAEAVGAAASGSGRVVVVVGERGSGRSRCAAAAARAAGEAGLRVLQAHTGGVAVGVPFEVLTDVFAELAGTPAGDERFAGAAAEAWPLVTGRAIPGPPEERDRMVHALHWLVRRLAAERPLALIVDDADVADQETVRCLEYIASRSIALPVLVLVTVTSQAQGRPAEIRTSLSGLPSATVVRLPAATPQDVEAMLAARGMSPGDAAFAAVCLRDADANHGLIGELLDELRARGLEPTAAALEALSAPTSTIRTVTTRLRRLGPAAATVADAVLVLAEDATAARVARIADLPLDEVRAHVDGLAAAALLSPGDEPRIRCPLVLRALEAAPASFRRNELRAGAAALLLDEGVPVQRVVEHVHQAEPGSAGVAALALQAAAGEALAAGRLDEAERHLRRLSVEEPPGPVADAVRARLLAIQVALDRDGAAERHEAMLTRLDPAERAAAILHLADTLVVAGRRRAAAEAARRGAAALEAAGEPDGRGRLELTYALVARDLPGMAADARVTLDRMRGAAGAQASAGLLAAAAVDAVYACRPRAEAAGLARAAFAAARATRGPEAAWAVAVLLWCEEVAAARQACEELAADDSRHGEQGVLRAWCALAEGRLAEAAALPGAPGAGPERRSLGIAASAVASQARLELGDLGGAAAALAAPAQEPREERGLEAVGLGARGLLQLRSGDPAGAERTFARALDLAASAAMDNPAVVRAWFGSAAALRRLGRLDEARATSGELLERSRAFGAPEAEASALQVAAGLARTRAEGVGLAERSVELTAAASDLARARALLVSGGLLLRDGRRAPARERLREALDLAHRVGALGLEARAREELRAAGGRPRRTQLHGVQALTPAERQVAEHAGRGLSNRDIAAALYVTPKTVEWHLRNVFLKLGIGDRRELPAALGGDGGPPEGSEGSAT